MQIEIGILIAVGSFLIGYIVFMRNRDKDLHSKAKAEAEVSVKLDHIGSNVESIRRDTKATGQQMDKIQNQLIRVDESAKQAHKRIDEIGKGCN